MFINNWNERLEFASKLLAVSFKIGILVGGVAICGYSWLIGYFPSGVTIGDGLLFLLLATVMTILVTLFSLSFKSLGVALWPVWKCVIYLIRVLLFITNRLTNKNFDINALPNIRKPGFEDYGFALIGAPFAWFLAFQGWQAALITAGLLFFSSVMFSSFEEQKELTANVLEDEEVATEEKESASKTLREKGNRQLIMTIILPLVIPGALTMLFTGVMRLSDVRVESTVVHIKAPYSTYAEESGIKGEPSNFGANFLRFDEAQVLFKGIGSNTVLSLQPEDKDRVQIVVPNSSIHLLPN